MHRHVHGNLPVTSLLIVLSNSKPFQHYRELQNTHAQSMVTLNFLIHLILVEIPGWLGGWLVVGLGFGDVVSCVPR